MAKIARRTKTGKYYVERNKKGQIVKWTAIKASLQADRRKKARKQVKSGQGHKGDQ